MSDGLKCKLADVLAGLVSRKRSGFFLSVSSPCARMERGRRAVKNSMIEEAGFS